jgi:uncharacterized protein (TIGR02646 family)
MIKIVKSSEPEWFNDWKKQKNPKKNFPAETPIENIRVLITLVNEQGSICCYCGQKIAPDISSSHQEHFKPRSAFPELEYEYGNLHASCNSRLSCGTAKADHFDKEKCISPTDVEEARFIYTLEGEIHPRDLGDSAAEYMIRILNLNTKSLVGQRKQILSVVLSPFTMNDSARCELKKLRAAYQERDANNFYQEFRQVLTCYIDMQLQS